MSSSAFYREQAARMLAQAEAAEVNEKLFDAEEGTVITYTKAYRRPIRATHRSALHFYTYAAVCVMVEDEMRWFTTGVDGNHTYTTEEFVRYLVNADVSNINVWDHAVALKDWPLKQDSKNVCMIPDCGCDGTPHK